MIRYYILPAVYRTISDGVNTRIIGVEPKYLAALTAAQAAGNVMDLRGWNSEELAVDIGGNRVFNRLFYIIRIDATDFTQLDAQADAIQLTRQMLINNIVKLQALGINTTGLTLTTPLKAIEQRLFLWLQNRNVDLSTVTGINETIPA